MHLHEVEFEVPAPAGRSDVHHYLEEMLRARIPAGARPVRFAVTASDARRFRCEVGVLEGAATANGQAPASIFDFATRPFRREETFNTVLLVPTGVGAEIGGHSGDATPVARLLAEASDRLITHPNVVNAADINEMTDNALYVEGSVICRLLNGTVGLVPVRSNRILLVVERHEEDVFTESAINMANAARASAGIDVAEIVVTEGAFEMTPCYAASGRATGTVAGLDRLCEVIERHLDAADAVAVSSLVPVSRELHDRYFKYAAAVVNPYGGVEALLTHAVSGLYDRPVAHAPMYENWETWEEDAGILDPRLAAEGVSIAFLFSLLKGLHRSPRLVADPDAMRSAGVITAADVSCLVLPIGCLGLPTLAALCQGIPVVAVRENRNLMRNDLALLDWAPGQLWVVDNYLEAAGVVAALKAGVMPRSVRRSEPLAARTQGWTPATESLSAAAGIDEV